MNGRASWLVTAALLLAGCSGDEPGAPAVHEDRPSPTAAAPAVGPRGTLVVEVRYHGAPVTETIDVNKDVAQCGKEKRIETVVVGPGGGLRDAVAWLTDTTGTAGTERSRPVTLDQRGCEFQPPVLAMTPGPVDILNSDGILHNIHTVSTVNPPINKAQPKFKKVMAETFEKPEVIEVRCDVHSWMRGWIVVVPGPLFAVTDASGGARIEQVPPGTHSLTAWHAGLGTETREVAVKADETTTVQVDLTRSTPSRRDEGSARSP